MRPPPAGTDVGDEELVDTSPRTSLGIGAMTDVLQVVRALGLLVRRPCHTGGVLDPPEEPPGSPARGGTSSEGRRRFIRSVVFLVVATVALYVFLPQVTSLASSRRSLRDVDRPFAILALALQVLSWIWVWQLDRIALRHDDWFSVSSAVMAGNALGRVVPGAATPQSVALLRDAGLDGGQAAAGLTTSTLLQIGTALALPVVSVPALIAGTRVARGLETAMYIGLAALVVLVIVGVVILQTTACSRGLAGRSRPS